MIRFSVGALIVGIGAYLQSWWGLVGLIPIVTAALRFCPLYTVIGYCPFKQNPGA